MVPRATCYGPFIFRRIRTTEEIRPEPVVHNVFLRGKMRNEISVMQGRSSRRVADSRLVASAIQATLDYFGFLPCSRLYPNFRVTSTPFFHLMNEYPEIFLPPDETS